MASWLSNNDSSLSQPHTRDADKTLARFTTECPTLQDGRSDHFDKDDRITFLFKEPVAALNYGGMLAFPRPIAHDLRSNARRKQQQHIMLHHAVCLLPSSLHLYSSSNTHEERARLS